MDERVRRHAELVVEHSLELAPDDDVLVRAPTAAEELVVALYEAIGRRGARPMLSWRNPRATRAYLRAVDPDHLRTKNHGLAAMEAADAVVLVKGARNAAETGDVAPEVGAAASRAREPVLAARLDTRWVITQHPTAADAQRAEMSTAAWRDHVYDAVLRDWAAVRERQARAADRLAAAEELRLVVGDRTDLRLSVAGMDAYNDDATENLPGGEVATVPGVGSAEGRFAVDFPVRRNGREVTGAWLEFADGAVVEFGADRNEATLAEAIGTDAGARRPGELGIGTNDGIDRVSHNLLFDEKMGGTVHLALGQAMAECVPEGREANESAIHLDLLADAREDACLEADGETVYRDGRFRLEGAEG
jgi:aminopeptidase